jgi:hypothetical protein
VLVAGSSIFGARDGIAAAMAQLWTAEQSALQRSH